MKRAQVTAVGLDGRTRPAAVTDNAGRFVLKAIEPGRYHIRAERDGYVPGEYGARSAGRPGTIISLDSGQRFTDGDIYLQPYSSIAGFVADEENEPVPNASIYCLPQRVRGRGGDAMPAAIVTTNDAGEFRVGGLAPGRYLLAAVHRPPARLLAGANGAARRVQQHYAPVFYPGTSDISAAAAIPVSAGQDIRGINLTVRPSEAVNVRGRVVPFTAAGARASVSLFPRGSEAAGFLKMYTSLVNGPDGTFEIHGVIPGPYVLTLDMMDNAGRRGAYEAIDVGAAGVDNLEVPVATGLSIDGRVELDTGAAAAFPRMRVEVRSGGRAFMNAPVGDSDGCFTLAGLLPNSYTLNMAGMPEDLYLKSIKLGDVDVMESGLRVKGPAAQPVTVVLGTGAATVEGAVKDSRNDRRWATVVLVPAQAQHPSRYKAAVTDQYGSFAIRGISPGEYRLFAFEDLEPESQYDAEFLKRYENAGESLVLDERSHQTLTLKIIESRS